MVAGVSCRPQWVTEVREWEVREKDWTERKRARKQRIAEKWVDAKTARSLSESRVIEQTATEVSPTDLLTNTAMYTMDDITGNSLPLAVCLSQLTSIMALEENPVPNE